MLYQAQANIGQSAEQAKLGYLLTSCSIPNKPNCEVWLQLGSYKLPNKLSLVGGGGVLDQMKIRLTQPQVELEVGLSLAKLHFACISSWMKIG